MSLRPAVLLLLSTLLVLSGCQAHFTFTTDPEGGDEFAAVLERALPLVQAEVGTIVWIAGLS